MALSAQPTTSSGALKFVSDLAVGGAAAVVGKTTVAPMERVKLLLQVQYSHSDIAPDKRYRGIFDAFRRISNEQGISSLWRGNATNVARYFPTQALNFAFNDAYKRRFTRGVNPKLDSWGYGWRAMVAGGLAGCTTLCFVYPLDFVRTRLAADVGKTAGQGKTRRFTGFADCVRQTVKTTGVRGLYTGFSISLQTYFIYRSTYFGLYDVVRRKIGAEREDGRLHFAASFLVAEFVTFCASLMTYPWDTVRRRMMIAEKSGSEVNTNAISYGQRARMTAAQIWRKEGLLGFYKGAGANVLRSTGGALVMAIYEEAQKHL